MPHGSLLTSILFVQLYDMWLTDTFFFGPILINLILEFNILVKFLSFLDLFVCIFCFFKINYFSSYKIIFFFPFFLFLTYIFFYVRDDSCFSFKKINLFLNTVLKKWELFNWIWWPLLGI